ncbi:MAG: TonB-dependent receptor domain-containing protein [Bryobacteraceae bacterium]
MRLTGIVLNVADRRFERVTLQPSSVAETVTVEANAIALQTEEGSVGQVIQGGAAVELPLQQRRYTELALLAPGVTVATDLNPVTRGPGWFVANGNYQTQNNFLLDGFDNNQGTTNAQSLSSQVVQPSPDAIDEFRVQTNSYSAEFGRGAGAVVNVSLKSGTNALHGSGWYYNRNEALAANSWTNNANGQPPGPLSWNQFGGTIGGPIVRNKLFYFGDYEGFRLTSNTSYITTVPTLDEHNGIFPLSVTDPTTGAPFANQTIPSDRFDPLSKKLIDLYPAPNLSGSLDSSGRIFDNYGATRDNTENTHKFDIKSDYYFSEKDQFAFRYSYLRQGIFRDPILTGLADCGSCSTGEQFNLNQSIGSTWTRLFSPSIVNVFRFGVKGTNARFANATANGETAAAFGFQGIPSNLPATGGLPLIALGNNYQSIGTRNFRPQFQKPVEFQYLDTVSLVMGAHSIRTGVDFRTKNNSFADIQRRTPAYQFSGKYTGDSLADLLLGDTQSFQIQTAPIIEQLQQAVATFVQDDWKVRPTLTLNLGLRYEYTTPYYGVAPYRNANFDFQKGQLIQAKSDRDYLVNTNPTNFAPRLGLAWQAVPDRLSVRVGYGLFYSGEDIFGSDINLPLNPPNLVSVFLSREGNGPPPIRPSDPIPADILNNVQTRNLQIRAQDMNWKTPRVQQWNIALQTLLPGAATFEIAYVGNSGSHLIGSFDANQSNFGVDGSIPANRPYPQWAQIYEGKTVARSHYNALEAKLDKRFTRGWYSLASYTYASALDEFGAWGSDTEPQQRDCFRCELGPMRQVPRHRFTFANVYELPFGRGRIFGSNWNGAVDALLGGWQVSNIFTARSGLPLDVSLDPGGTDPITGQDINFLDINNGDGDLRPDRVGNPNTGIDPHTDRFHFLDVNAFRLQPVNTPGNSQRNVAVGPRFFTLDFGLQKNFRITEDSAPKCAAKRSI